MSSMKCGQNSVMTIRNVPIVGKTVLVRVDYDAPIEDGRLVDDVKIRQSIPTIERLLKDRCKVVIISETGSGEPHDSLEPAAVELARLLGRPIRFVSDCVGDRARMAVKRAPMSSVIVLENLRRHPESYRDGGFAERLARTSGASVFVQDDCGVVAESSVSSIGLPRYLPAVAGLLVEESLDVDMDGIIRPGVESLLRWYPL